MLGPRIWRDWYGTYLVRPHSLHKATRIVTLYRLTSEVLSYFLQALLLCHPNIQNLYILERLGELWLADTNLDVTTMQLGLFLAYPYRFIVHWTNPVLSKHMLKLI